MIDIAFAMNQLIKLWLFTNSPIVSDGYFIRSLKAFCTFLHIFAHFLHISPLLFEFVPCAYSALNANIAKDNFLFFSFLRYFCLFLINFDMDFFVSSVLLLRAISTRIRTIIHTRFTNYKQGVIFYEKGIRNVVIAILSAGSSRCHTTG